MNAARTKNRKPSPLQHKLAEELIFNHQRQKPLHAGQLLEKVGYSKHLAKQPGRVIELKGVQKALAELGFHEDNAKRVVAEILNGKKQQSKDRLKAADMVFKVHGTYAPEQHHTAFAGLLNVITESAKPVEVVEVKKGDSEDNEQP